MNNQKDTIMQVVDQLHSAARTLESTLGQSELTHSIRQHADRVNELAKVEHGHSSTN